MKTDFKIRKKLIAGAIILAPFIISAIYLLPIGQNMFKVLPCTSDELFYYNQIKSVLAYGQPQGYYGYAGSHALVGHFGAHGFAWIIPYCLGTIVSGIKYYSIAVVNHILLAISLVLVYELRNRSIIPVVTILLFYFIPSFGYYMNSAMMEGLNYNIAIILAVLLYYLSCCPKQNGWVVITIAIILCYFCTCKVMWVILWAPYFYIVTRRKRLGKRIGMVVLGTGIMVVVFYGIHAITASSYYDNSYFVDRVLAVWKGSGATSAIYFFMTEVKYNIWLTLNEPLPDMYTDLRLIMLIGGGAIIVYSVIACVVKKSLIQAIPIVVFGGYCVGTVCLYGGGHNAIRTVFPGFIFALTYVALTKNRLVSGALVLMMLAMLVFNVWGHATSRYDDRIWYDIDVQNNYANLMKPISEIEVDKEGSAWSNTLLYPTTQAIHSSLLYLPSGVGINLYKELPENLQSIREGWIILDLNYEAEIKRLEEAGYIIYRKESESCLLKRK